MNDEIQAPGSDPDQLREQAVRSLKKKAAFRSSLIVYVVVNALLVVIWAASGGGYFWPIWVIGGWGIGVALQAWDAYGQRKTISEDQISEEMNRLRGG